MIAIAKDIMLVVVMMIAIDSGDDDQNTTNPSIYHDNIIYNQ
jgi:hypothetical protein